MSDIDDLLWGCGVFMGVFALFLTAIDLLSLRVFLLPIEQIGVSIDALTTLLSPLGMVMYVVLIATPVLFVALIASTIEPAVDADDVLGIVADLTEPADSEPDDETETWTVSKSTWDGIKEDERTVETVREEYARGEISDLELEDEIEDVLDDVQEESEREELVEHE